MEVDQSYVGREHSLIKHKLLENYLERLLFIVGISGVKEIAYIDCFAGPWGDASENLAGTSIAISLGKLKKVRDALAAPPHEIYDLKIHAVYVEKNRSNFARLESYLDENRTSTVKCHPLQGDYSNLQEDILKKSGNGFAFFFIDPKGWTDVSIPKLTKLLQRPNSEFLITFMYDFLNRFVGVDELRPQIEGLLGDIDEEWLDKLRAMDPNHREAEVVRRYCEQLKLAMYTDREQKPRSYYATVQDTDKDKTKYHMVYLTRHSKGVVVFSDISEKVELIQRRVRYELDDERVGQMSLLPIEDEELRNQFSANIEDVKSFWLGHLTGLPSRYNELNLADWLEETGWLESDFQMAFKVLRKENLVENLDDKSNRRTKRFVHFEKKGELLRKCVSA